MAPLGLTYPSNAHADSPVPVQQDPAFQLLSPERRRRTFFTYEKRVREFSPPDKTFDYFSSVQGPGGSRLMHPQDLMHALVATYPSDEGPERAGALAGEKAAERPPPAASAFFEQFDLDGDGLISYEEFLLVMSFLAILPEDVATVFAVLDENANSMISKEEFAAVTAALRRRLRRVSHLQRTGLETSSGREATGGLMATFFGADGRQELDLRHFDDFIEALHVELVRLEYCHYDPEGQGWMSGCAFAHSLVASVPMTSVGNYLARVEQLPPALAGCKVSHQSFGAWATLRRRGGHKLAVALEMLNTVCSAGVRRADLQRAARLACGYALPNELVDIVQTDTLFLVGDVLDGWKLKSHWYWPESHTAVLHQLYELARKGTRICYVPGNHDEAARAYLTDEAVAFGNVEVVQETTHTCADGRRFLVLHGDRCDTSVHLSSALTRALGDWVYDQFVNLNILIKATRRFLRLPYWSLAAHVNGNSKFAIEMVGRYEEALANEAKRLGLDGVICGHIHKPIIRRIDDVLYVNDGDWVDSCSALVEDFDGQLDIIYWQPIFEQRQQERARQQRERAAAATTAAAGSEAEEGATAGKAPAHSHAEPPAVGPPTPQYGPGGTQAVDLALRIMIGSSVPNQRRLDVDRLAQPGGRRR
ncbi:hypothetical protein WJX81_008619 [Elliptochloris bilobata]|uniref:EF-hand domain-containing protein n=1 Tax=Elliptochloris bilobata TaxID=381761 RepID=A0AAW1S4Q7_9CHLO